VLRAACQGAQLQLDAIDLGVERGLEWVIFADPAHIARRFSWSWPSPYAAHRPVCQNRSRSICDLRYLGQLGLHFLTLQVSIDQSRGRYALAAEVETRSLVDLFLDPHSKLEAHGRVADGWLFPEAMRAETHRRGLDLRTRVDYGADGAVTAKATPPSSNSVTPVSPVQMHGTVDQLTAYLELAHHLAARGSCALALAAFDGRRRYDLSFTDLASEALPGLPGSAGCGAAGLPVFRWIAAAINRPTKENCGSPG
jgi:hypothetical protein